MITLQPITSKNLGAVWKMKADPELVAPNNWSLAEAYAYSYEHGHDKLLVRAIYDDETPVGFLMANYDPKYEYVDNKGEPYFYLWRLMVDEQYQNKGYGRAAMELLIAEVKTGKHGKANAFYTGTARQSEVTPKFYGSLGFVYTGEVDRDECSDENHDEDIMRLEI
ncbi:MAG: GNAT family N-acetyltransferase [Defluviitaleaceae bacterium]|nr:GNAT family N-acetyltransferase [Defluviitaleaceae bacterium]